MLHSLVDQLKLIDQMETLIENNQHYTMWEITDILKIANSSVVNYLNQVGYVNHFNVQVPPKLRFHLPDHISTCDSLLKHNENILILKQIVMGDEK